MAKATNNDNNTVYWMLFISIVSKFYKSSAKNPTIARLRQPDEEQISEVGRVVIISSG